MTRLAAQSFVARASAALLLCAQGFGQDLPGTTRAPDSDTREILCDQLSCVTTEQSTSNLLRFVSTIAEQRVPEKFEHWRILGVEQASWPILLAYARAFHDVDHSYQQTLKGELCSRRDGIETRAALAAELELKSDLSAKARLAYFNDLEALLPTKDFQALVDWAEGHRSNISNWTVDWATKLELDQEEPQVFLARYCTHRARSVATRSPLPKLAERYYSESS